MKRNDFLLRVVLLLCSVTVSISAAAGGPTWTAKYDHPKCFIENKGQFKLPGSNDAVEYAYDKGSVRIYFTKTGLTYSLLKVWKKEEEEGEKEKDTHKESFQDVKTLEQWKKKEEEEHKAHYIADYVNLEWVGADPNAEIVAESPLPNYFSYSFRDKDGKMLNENYLKGYEKITYKNIYPNIDVEYTFHPSDGIKYSIILHPGADPSVIRMKYTDADGLSIHDGNLSISTKLGKIIDHAPITFYESGKEAIIPSQFIREGSEVHFKLDAYDKNQTVVIDPWTVMPSFATNWDCVWECEKDGAGNVYIIGGVTPLQLLKYNAAGALQWTYNTPYDTSSWLGTFATDNVGNSYVTQGSIAEILKVNTAGGLVWSNTSPGGLFGSTEFWNIAFNCDQTELVIGGTGGFIPPLPYVYNVDVATGNMTASLQVTGGALFPTQEVRSITACGNGKFYWLSHDSIGFFNQNFSFCPTGSASARYHRSNSYSFSYKCENWRYDNTGINAIRANTNFVYTHKGSAVDKRSLTTANIITTAAIAGGGFASGQVKNSGIDIDACGNVYVGSQNSVVKYDANLTLLATYPVSFNVYDVHVSTGGDIIACGSTGTSGTAVRTGYIQSIPAGACGILTLTCCDATICAPATICASASPVTLQAATPGGTWSGTGVTAGGVFNPAVSGVGTFTITYTLACGTDAVSITVSPCTALVLCQGAGNTASVSGGTGPYNWQSSTTTTSCVSGIGFCSGPFTVTGPPVTTWTTFTTGTTATMPGTYPIQVVDAGGTIATIANAAAYAALPSCTSCPPLTVNISGQVNVTCFGASTGSFNASTTGGASPWDYTLMNGAATVASFTNVPGTQAFTGLPAGTYTLNVLDNNGCPGTTTITITQPSGPTTTSNAGPGQTLCSSSATLAGNTPTVGTGTWTLVSGAGTITTPSSPSSTVTALGVGANIFMWTIANPPCPSSTDTVTIFNTGGPTTSNAGSPQTVCGSTATLAGNTPATGTGTWTLVSGSGTITTPASPTSGITGLGAGANVFMWTISNPPCTASTSTVTITGVNPPTTANAGPTISGCSSSATMAGNTPATGTGTWTLVSGAGTITTPSSPTTTITGLGAGANVFMWTISNAPCAASTDTMTIFDTGGPTTANAGATQTICGTTATLAGNTPTVGTGTWTVVSGTGSITTPSSPTSGVTGLSTGANVFMWTISNPPCSPTTDTVTIFRSPPPTVASAGPTQSGCSTSVTMAANTPVVGTGTWTLVSGAGAITSSGSPTTTITGLGAGANVFMWTISSPPCTASTDTVTIFNTGGPTTANAGPAQTVCGTTATLAGNTPTVGTGTWTLTSGSGTITTPSSPTSGVTGLGAGPNVFTWTISSPPCAPSASTVTITGVAPPTTANAGASQSICSSSATLAGNTPTVGTGTWTLVSGSGTITSPGSPSSTVTGLGVGANVFMWTISNAPCPSSTSTVTITNTGGPGLSVTSQTNVLCNGNGNGTATVSGSGGTGSYTYSWSGGAGSSATASGLSAGTYTVTVTDGAGCSSTAFVNITQPAAITGSVSTTSTTCGSSTGTATANASGGTGSLTYSWSPGGATTSSITGLPAGGYTVVITDSSGCTQSASGAVGSVGGPPVNAGADVTITSGETATLSGTSSAGATYSWSPSGSVSCATCATTTTSPTQTTTYTLTVNVGGCTSSDTVTVFVEIECGELFVPNVFSPNGDGANDVLQVYGNCITDLDFAIYDRWGEKVFETTDPSITWDGRYKGNMLDVAVFVYYLKATVKGVEVNKHGNITLVK
ncbi:MAG: gliding motility-associated C-terminal domain-containing protein [Bacteroidia bacterium]